MVMNIQKKMVVQCRCIRHWAKVKKLNPDQVGALWCTCGLAEQFAKYWESIQ